MKNYHYLVTQNTVAGIEATCTCRRWRRARAVGFGKQAKVEANIHRRFLDHLKSISLQERVRKMRIALRFGRSLGLEPHP